MLVGVLGGMGPKATFDFLDMVTDNTKVSCDQDHINMLVYSHAEIPDRTSFILGKSNKSPLPYLVNDAKLLEKNGCDFLVLTCNTSHYFYDDIVKEISIPLLNMPEEAAKVINNNPRIKKVGILATTGTISCKIYDKYLKKEIFVADEKLNNRVMNLIYDKVKKGIKVSKMEFYDVLNEYFDNGCDAVIMGCTELSVIVRDNDLYSDKRIVDAMKILVDKTISLAKKDMD